MIVHQQESYDRPLRLVLPFFCLHIFSFFSLSTLLATFVCSRLHRDWTVFGLLLIFPLSNWATSILAVSGRVMSEAPPPFGVCLSNAALVLGGSSALSAAALAVVLRLFLVVLSVNGWSHTWTSRWQFTALLLLLPYLVWAVLISLGVARGLNNRPSVHRAVFYCVIEDDTLDIVSAVLPIALLALTILLQIATAAILLHHWRQLRRLTRGHSLQVETPPLSKTAKAMAARFRTLNFPLAFRVLLFLGCVIVALVIAVISMGDWTGVVGDFAISAIGPLVFFIFATQRDVLQTWHILPHDSSRSSFPDSCSSVPRLSRSNPSYGHDPAPREEAGLALSPLDRLQVSPTRESPSDTIDYRDEEFNKSTECFD